MCNEKAIFNRTRLLVGDAIMESIAQKKVIIFGVGGVGSWCAESLIRSGIQELTIVDSDCVSITNVNRQSMANMSTVGSVKVEALKADLKTIHPQANIHAVQEIYSTETKAAFHLEEYDYIVDAIDSLECKAELILHATSLSPDIKFFSSMGAALKMDPTKVLVDEFWKVKGCPLARALRQKFKRKRLFPQRKFKVVFSPEVLPNLGDAQALETEAGMQDMACESAGREDLQNHDWSTQKAQINGTMSHITAIFGFTIAGLILEDIYKKALPPKKQE